MPNADSELSRRYFKELRFRQFRAFREVARTMSFAAAAEVLRISRPSLWQQVRALEEELGAELLRTENQQISLTEDGVVLLDLISPLVESFDAVRSIFADRRRDLVRRLNVATTSSLLANELQRPVRLYAGQNTGVRFSFVERPSKEALPLLASGVADLAIVGILDDAARPAGFEYDDWVRYPFALVCPPNHTLARARNIALEDIVKHPLLLPTEATNARQRVDAVLRGAGLLKGIHGVIESSTARVLASYVEMGLGIALCSLSPLLVSELQTGAQGCRPLVVREVTSLFGEEPVVIVRRKGGHLLSHIDGFRKLTLSSPLTYP